MKERKRNVKKIVAFSLCFTMAFTMIPTKSFAQPNKNSDIPSKENIINEDKTNIAEQIDENISLYTDDKTINMKKLDIVVKGTTTANLNIRESAAASSEKIGYLSDGDNVSICGFQKVDGDVWYEISHQRKKGYISSKYVSVYATTYKNRVGVTLNNISVYAADDNNLIIESFQIKKGEKFEIVNRISTNKGSMYRIKYAGKYGYIETKDVNLNPILNQEIYPKTIVVKLDNSIDLYKSTTINNTVVGKANSGSEILITGKVVRSAEEWYKTSYKGKTAYCKAKFIDLIAVRYKGKIGLTKATINAYNMKDGKAIKSFQIPKGKNFEPLEKIVTKEGNYYKISYQSRTGYISSENINLNPILDTIKFNKSINVELDRDLYMYKGTTINNTVLATAPKGTKLVLTEKIIRSADEWYKTTYKGKTVYCKSKYIDLYATKYSNRQGKTLEKIQVYKAEGGKLQKSFEIAKDKYFDIIARMSIETGDIYEIKYGSKKGYITTKNVNLNPVVKQFKYSSPVHIELDRNLYMYKSTTINNTVLATAPKGTKLVLREKIYRSKEPWYKTTYNGKTVYCKCKYVKLSSKTFPTNTVRKTKGSFYIYKEPSTNAEAILKVPTNTNVTLIGKVFTDKETYLEIKYNGNTGYVDEEKVKNIIMEDYIVNSYSYTMDVHCKTNTRTGLYKEPTEDSQRVYLLEAGTNLNAVGRVNKSLDSWYKIEYKGKTLYAKSDDITLSEVVYKGIVGAYTKSPVNLRSSIGTDVSVKCTIPEKGVLEVIAKFDTSQGKWYKVKYAGTSGYVKGSYIKISQMGIDISTYNANIDWEQVKTSGIDFVFIRAGYTGYVTGTCATDARFKSHIEGAISAGLDIGIYYFTQAINEKEAKREAQYAIDLIEPYKEHVNLPIVIDTEFINSSRPGRADHLSKTQRTKVVKAFCDEVERQNRTPMIYMSKSWIHSQLNYKELDHFPLWVAQYNTCNTTPEPWDYWQFTSSGEVPGIKGRVDMNIKM